MNSTLKEIIKLLKKNNIFFFIFFLLFTKKIWKLIIVIKILIYTISLINLLFIIFKKKKKHILKKNIIGRNSAKLVYLFKKKKNIKEILSYFIFGYLIIFILGVSLRLIYISLNYIQKLKSHILSFGVKNILKFHFFFIKNELDFEIDYVKVYFKEKTLYYIKSPAYIIEEFYISKYGPTMAEKNFCIIELTFINLIKTYNSERSIFFLKKKILLMEKPEVLSIIVDIVEENSLLKFYSIKSINYWSQVNVDFVNLVYPMNDLIVWKQYKIKNIQIKHSYNEIKIEIDEIDGLLALRLILEKIKNLNFFNISIMEIRSGEKKIDDIENLSIINLFKLIIINKEITIVTNSSEEEILPLWTYPLFDNMQITPIIDKENY